jgi:signal transduction histidine kinase
MMGWWSGASIRVRLTAWYATALTLLLIVYATATFIAVRHEFREQLDAQLHGDVAEHEATLDPEARVEQQLREILVVLVSGLPLIVVLAGLGGYTLARRALAPIDHLGTEAQRITAERLHERLSVPNEKDEVGRLAAVINDTLARLESSFDHLRRFTADASHELRTPLSVIRGIGEMNLRETRTPADYKDAMGSMLEEVDRLTRLVETLLRLSRGDTGTVRLTRETVDLGPLTRDVVASLSILAEERQQRVTVDAQEHIHVSVDRLVLGDAIANVIDNAIKYSSAGSTIDVRVHQDGEFGAIAVTDQGPGIPAEHRERIFDRFYRIDEGRSRAMGGTGLGLAIAKWAVEINGGRISVDSADRGSVFRIVIPRVEVPMKVPVKYIAGALIILPLTVICVAAVAATVNFDTLPAGTAPAGWTATQTGTGQAKWAVVADDTAPSKPNVLKQSGQATYPVCIKDDTSVKDGFVEVKFKALSGKEDQAGGVLWRAKDANNYYIARANALEDNVTIYHTINGRRTEKKRVNMKVPAKEWHTLRVEFQGNHFTVSVNGRMALDWNDDTFKDAGKVGVWTKADSVTVFDDFTYGSK